MWYFSTLKKKQILWCDTTWVTPENIIFSEINGSQKDKFCKIPLRWDGCTVVTAQKKSWLFRQALERLRSCKHQRKSYIMGSKETTERLLTGILKKSRHYTSPEYVWQAPGLCRIMRANAQLSVIFVLQYKANL